MPEEYPLREKITLSQEGYSDLVIRQIEPGVWQMKMPGCNADGNPKWNTIHGITHEQVIDQIKRYLKEVKPGMGIPKPMIAPWIYAGRNTVHARLDVPRTARPIARQMFTNYVAPQAKRPKHERERV